MVNFPDLQRAEGDLQNHQRKQPDRCRIMATGSYNFSVGQADKAARQTATGTIQPKQTTDQTERRQGLIPDWYHHFPVSPDT